MGASSSSGLTVPIPYSALRHNTKQRVEVAHKVQVWVEGDGSHRTAANLRAGIFMLG